MKRILLTLLIFSSLVSLSQAQTPKDSPAQEQPAVVAEETKTGKEAAAPNAASQTQQVSTEKDKTAPTDPTIEKDLQEAANDSAEPSENFVTPREEVEEQPVPEKKELVVYQPKNRRDPTLSPDDFLLLQYREQQRLAALEAERQRQLAEERRKQEEAERLRQLELARIKDPTREVRNRIHIGGIVGQEVFIGDKVYTVGNKIFGARIVEVTPDSVVFTYKGHQFVRKMK